jgi:hypothetical protein
MKRFAVALRSEQNSPGAPVITSKFVLDKCYLATPVGVGYSVASETRRQDPRSKDSLQLSSGNLWLAQTFSRW